MADGFSPDDATPVQATPDAGAPAGDAAGAAQAEATPEHWSASLPEDMREGFKDVPDVATVAKEYQELKQALSVPETVDGYQIDIPEGHPTDPAFIEAIKAGALAEGVPPAMLNKLAQKVVEYERNITAQAMSDLKASYATLENEWGPKAGDNYAIAMKGATWFGEGDSSIFAEMIKNKQMRPEAVKQFMRLGAAISEHHFIMDDAGPTPETTQYTQSGVPMLKYPSMEKRQ